MLRTEGIGRPEVDAAVLLRDLVAVYDAGRREPIPLPIKTSYAWAAARHCGDSPEGEARYRWKSGDRYPGEDAEPAHVRAWGERADLSILIDKGLGDYAERVWLPMLRAGRQAE
jgi:exodeoxyribonuclease V gamma subunit